MATPEEVRGFTVEKLRELCAEKHISITARKKEELISALLEARKADADSKSTPDGSILTGPSTAELFHLILTMQKHIDGEPAKAAGGVDTAPARRTARGDGEDAGAAGERTCSN